MPRPRNQILRELVQSNGMNQIICNNGNCNGKVLNQHAGNIERHLRLLHPAMYSAYMEKKLAAIQKKTVNTTTTNAITTDANATHDTSKIKIKIQKYETLKTNIDLAIVEFFTKSEQPLSLLEDKAFKVMVKPAFQSLGIRVNRQSVLELINGCSEKLKTEIINDLSGSLFSLKIDVATRDDTTLLGINVHYIKESKKHVKSLAIKELKISYTSEHLKSVITDILNEHRFDAQQILSISAGNNKHIIDGINELNEEFNSTMCVENEASSKFIKKENDVTNTSFDEFLDYSEPEFSTYKIASVVSGEHVLQLCMDEIFQNTELKLKLGKCKTIVKELKNQTSYLNGLNDNSNATSESAHDWALTYETLERLHEVKEMVMPLSLKNIGFYLNAEEWSFVKEFVEASKHFYKATIRFQAEQLCYSELFVIIMEILFELEKLSANNITKPLIASLNDQKLKLLDTDLFITAVYLDPRIRVCLDATQKTRAKEYIATLHNRINSLRVDTTTSETNDSSLLVERSMDEQPTTSNNLAAPKSFGEFLQHIDDSASIRPQSNFEMDIALYERQPRLPLNASIMDFWYYQHNCLSDIAHIILAIPCTDVSVESLSSALQCILTEKNYGLTASNIEHILRVKVNGVFDYEE